MFEKLVLQALFQVQAGCTSLRQTVDRVHHQMKAVDVVAHRHVERRRDAAFFLVAADMDVAVVGAPVGQPVDQRRVGMEGEDDLFVAREYFIEIGVAMVVRPNPYCGD